jgi:cytochrome o ubiquinol oxidase subunit 3
MTKPESMQLVPENSHSVEDISKSNLGFWIYLMTDCVVFASLFAVYAVMHKSTSGGPNAAELFSLPFVLIETIILLTSSFTSGLVTLAAVNKNKKMVIFWLVVTFLLGASFLAMELFEFSKLVGEGHSWQASGFLSSYFTLVGTHGLHIAVGLVWLVFLVVFVLSRGLTYESHKRLTLFSTFWHFLDIVWIFIFSMVYLLGVLDL